MAADLIPVAAAAFTLGGLTVLLVMRRPTHRCTVCETDLPPICGDRAACHRRAAERELEHVGT